ncbi:hypothetical protein ACCO45_011420 [Purpureocillium lilacinum]|uniref:Uncharacterized protein n=1 Tax=Purpureocillium lilacinum TaxID=33203 RepID=A0ACC4DAX1_PURLI
MSFSLQEPLAITNRSCHAEASTEDRVLQTPALSLAAASVKRFTAGAGGSLLAAPQARHRPGLSTLHSHATRTPPAGQCRPPQPSLGRYHALQARPGQRPSAWGSPGETGLPATSAFQSPGPRAGKVLRCGRRSRGAVHPRDTERQVPSSLSPLQFPSTSLPAGSVAASAAHRCAPGSTAWLTRLSGSTDSRRPGHPGLASPCLARPSLPATPDPSPPAYPPPCLTARVPPSATFTRPISEHPARHNLDALVHPHLPSATASLVAIPQSRRGLGSSPHGKETHRSARGRRDSSPVVAAALPDSLLSFGASSSRLIPRAPVASPELCGLTARLPRISAETRVDDEPPLGGSSIGLRRVGYPQAATSSSSSTPRPALPLESVQEDIHTRNLLFPDAQALYQHRNDQVFDLSSAPATPSAAAANSYDVSEDFELDSRDVRVIILQDALGPTNASLLPQPRQGAFDRRASVHGRSQSYAETDAQRVAREYREELATFSSCIFGNSELMAYKGTSTKVHVVPSDTRPAEYSASAFGDGRSSISRSSGRSKESPHHKTVPVNLTAEDADANVTPQSRFSDDNSGFPFPSAGDDSASGKKKKPQPKQRRTPILFSSSYNSTKAGWNMTGSGNYGDITDSSYSIDFEDRIDWLTQHWDIIMRTLTHLQSVAATTIHGMLKQADIASPGPYSTSAASNLISRTPSLSDRRGNDTHRAKPHKSTTKLVSLAPTCLNSDVNIAHEAGLARTRVVLGLSASRVVTGQGRWGIWRDEAIWTSRWLSSPEKGQFFYNLLTGFLATHTDWLQALCGPAFSKRAATARRNRNEEDLSLPARTIVVSDDKMAARRLIFLLSAFLPASQQVSPARPHRPSTSASLGGYSNSPPTFIVPILREESLRRKINRRSSLRRASHSRTASQSTRTSGVPSQLAHLTLDRNQHQRRASDAASIRTTNIPMPGQDFVNRKSSAATTATIVPEATTPHFATAQQQRDNHRRRRPGSSGSVAADDLKRSLKRVESSGQATSASSRPTSQGVEMG